MTGDTQSYDTATIRKLLLAAFTADELRRFCQDRVTFSPVVGKFASGDGLDRMADKLVDYCRTRLLWEELLTAVEKENPRQYARFESHLHYSLASDETTPQPRLPYWAVAVAIIGVILLALVGLVLYWVLTGSTITGTPQSRVLYSLPGPVHLGDESHKPGWEPLSGDCLILDFDATLPIQTLTLRFETFGAESRNEILLNGVKFDQVPIQGVDQPDEWAPPRVIFVPIHGLVQGANRLTICSALVEVEPDFDGDLDDFRIRNVQLVAE